MDSFREYPIRCKTCGEPIACKARAFEQALSTGISREEALSGVDLTAYCSRSAMLNPPIVTFDMENREAIEGFKDVRTVVDADPNGSLSDPIFAACTPELQFKLNLPPPQFQPTFMQGTKALPAQIGIGTGATTGIPVIGMTLPTPPQGINPGITSGTKPGIPLNPGGAEPKQGIPLSVPDNETEFIEPSIVGVPSINSSLPLKQINVGAGKKVQVLNGRSYLAR